MIKAKDQIDTKGLTQNEIKKKENEKIHEEMDYLKEVDKSTGQGFVADWEKKEEKEEYKNRENWKDVVGSAKTDPRYKERLCDYGNKKIPKLDFGDNWVAQFVPTKKSGVLSVANKRFHTKDGLAFILISPKGNVFIRAISVYYQPEIDFAGVDTLLTQAENTYDSYRGALNEDNGSGMKKTESGIYIPN